ncbi:MAG TPA: (5-formylfuran-3-yl)methyl phosphate synthase [Candidatus Bathyarchaeia archaeon]|nr:(5-formylfuran-3-yl)methyl phosphate synthase [Candidatus Bathyarchaeia archaeon]
MKLLISSTDEKEAVEAIAGGADIIDVKNPKEGALGANFPWVIKRIREITPKNIEVSCTLGDVPNLPGAISLAALGAATTGVDYVKAGLCGLKTREEAVCLMQNVTRAAKDWNSSIKVVATGYADAKRMGSVNPMLIPNIAHKAEADIAMIDTAVKDGKNLFAFLTINQLRRFVDTAHDYGLKAALAGSLRKEDLPAVYALGADVAGLRGAACTRGDRVDGRITRETVRELVEVVKRVEEQAEFKV